MEQTDRIRVKKQAPPEDAFSDRVQDGMKGRIAKAFSPKQTKPKMEKVAGMAEVDIDKVVKLSQEASRSYLLGGESLNSAIAKIAAEEGLNSDQVQRLVETSNMITYQYLYKKATEDKNIVFDIANPDKIKEILVKTASEREAAVLNPRVERAVSSNFSAPPVSVLSDTVKVAEEVVPERKPSTNDIAQEQMRKHAHTRALIETTPRVAEMVKAAMVAGSSLEASPNFLGRFLTICKIAVDMSDETSMPITTELMAKVASYLGRGGLLTKEDMAKVAASLTDTGLLPSLPSNKVVSRDHILIKTLRSYVDCCKDAVDPPILKVKTESVIEG